MPQHKTPFPKMDWTAALLMGLLVTATTAAQQTIQSANPSADKLPVQTESVQPAVRPSNPVIDGDGKRLYQMMLHGVTFITAAEGNSLSGGTGWVFDVKDRLVITNYHVVANSQDQVLSDIAITVYFPEYRRGQLITEKGHYLRSGREFRAEILDADRLRDLAILQLESLPTDVEAIELSPESPSPGERVHSVGNPGASDAAWVYTSGAVRQVYHARASYRGGTVREFQRVETQSPTNPGDSGGPVVNDQGKLVAVNEGLSNEGRLMSWFIDVSDVRDFVTQARKLLKATTADELNDRGVHYYEQERFDKALSDFTAAMELDSTLADAHGNRGWTLMQLGDIPTAILEFDEAIRLNDRDANYYEGRATAHIGNDQIDLAIKDFTQAIRFDPRNTDLYRERGEAYASTEKYEQAIADYTRGIGLQQDADLYNARGVAYADWGKPQDAIADYNRAIELDAQSAVYYHNRALAYYNQDNLEEALQDLARMEYVDPEYAKEQKQTLYRRYIIVKNASDQPIHVYLKFHGWNPDDQWQWYPSPPGDNNWAEYLYEPGEEAYVQYKGDRVSADRIRIWAESKFDDGMVTWVDNRDVDYVVVSDEGYPHYFMGSATNTFRITDPPEPAHGAKR